MTFEVEITRNGSYMFFLKGRRIDPLLKTMGEDCWVEEAFSPCLFNAISRQWSLVVIKPGMPPPCAHNSITSIQDHALGLVHMFLLSSQGMRQARKTYEP